MEAAHAISRTERLFVLFLCLLGAAHVFVFSAAFPFFSVADEQMHFDLAVHYSQGEIPRTLVPASPESLPFLVIYGSPEYLGAAATQPGDNIPPWKQPVARTRETLQAKQAAYRDIFKNHEAASPPLYYSLAGGWWRLARGLHLEGIQSLYWLRFMNVLLLGVLVWLGWLTAKIIFPESLFIRIAVPALAAFFPQSVFYAINNDILAPLTFGLAFLLVFKFWEADAPSLRIAIATGLALAASFLTKTSNLPLVLVAALFIALKIVPLVWRGKLRTSLAPLLALFITAGLPMAAWLAWCKMNFGDFTGSSLKIHFLNWTDQPSRYWLAHPLFTGHGLWYFLSKNLTTFWQGEQLWHRQPMSIPGVDSTYEVLTLGALAFTLAALLRRASPFTTPQRLAVWFGLLCLAALLAFYAVLSIKFDFQDCFYPSRALPYFVSGRLLLGALVPFLILFACGLDRLMKKFDNSTKFFVLLAVLGFMLASELTIDWPVFASPYNWFHL